MGTPTAMPISMQRRSFAQDLAEYRGGAGAEGHANADVTSAARYSEGHDAVEAHTREHDGQEAERGGETRDEIIRVERFEYQAGHGVDFDFGDGGIGVVNDGAERRGDGGGICGGANLKEATALRPEWIEHG